MREGVTSEERERIVVLESENRELRLANEILNLASVSFPGEARPQTRSLIGLTDWQRDTRGVEPICSLLQIALAGYRCHAAQQRASELGCAWAKRCSPSVPTQRTITARGQPTFIRCSERLGEVVQSPLRGSQAKGARPLTASARLK